MRTRRQKILDVADDLMGALLYYDRKEDEDLPVGALNDALRSGEVTVDELVEHWRKALEGAKEDFTK